MVSSLLRNWSFEPGVMVGLLMLAGVYLRGLYLLVRRGKWTRLVNWVPATCFGLGWLALLLALESPIDALSVDLFSVHMVQHLLLLTVAPLLLLLGKPVSVLLVGMPRGLASALGRVHSRRSWLRSFTHTVTSLRFSWTAYVGTLLLWHLPVLYQAALTHPALHALEHVCFFTTALAFWWVIVEPFPGPVRRHYGVRMIAAWTPVLPTIGLGSLFALTDQPWYPVYAHAARPGGFSLLEDQQAGGIIMWLGGGMMYVTVAAVLLYLMLAEDERTAPTDADLRAAESRATISDPI